MSTSHDRAVDHRRPSGIISFLTLSGLANLGARDIGLLVLRIGTLALTMHGIHKAQGYAGFVQGLAKNPVGAIAPDLFGFLVVAGQILLPIFIAVGLFTRWSGLLQAILFAFIIGAVNIPNNGLFNLKQGGFTFDSSLFYFIPGLALFFLGAGRVSLDHMLNKVEDLRRGFVDRHHEVDGRRDVTTTR